MSYEIDPEYRAYLEERATDGIPPRHSLSTAGARQVVEEGPEKESPTVAASRNLLVPGPNGDVPIRVYFPTTDPPHPVLLFIHGGGWVRGSLDGVDAKCRAIANRSGVLVVSVDYRLAPEHPFPAAVEDCIAALRWIHEYADTISADPTRCAVGGMSAGGNLTAVLSRWARSRSDVSIDYQLLLNPVTDYEPDNESYETFDRAFWRDLCPPGAGGYPLSLEDMTWYWRRYLRSDLDAANPHVSPLRASDVSGVPPATVVTSELDPLRDEGREYADRLAAAGVPVEHFEYEGAFHSYVALFSDLEGADAALDEISYSLVDGLEG